MLQRLVSSCLLIPPAPTNASVVELVPQPSGAADVIPPKICLCGAAAGVWREVLHTELAALGHPFSLVDMHDVRHASGCIVVESIDPESKKQEEIILRDIPDAMESHLTMILLKSRAECTDQIKQLAMGNEWSIGVCTDPREALEKYAQRLHWRGLFEQGVAPISLEPQMPHNEDFQV